VFLFPWTCEGIAVYPSEPQRRLIHKLILKSTHKIIFTKQLTNIIYKLSNYESPRTSHPLGDRPSTDCQVLNVRYWARRRQADCAKSPAWAVVGCTTFARVGGQFGNKQTAGFTIKISMRITNKNYIKTLLIIKTIDAIKVAYRELQAIET
jgi:hypothetical protein